MHHRSLREGIVLGASIAFLVVLFQIAGQAAPPGLPDIPMDVFAPVPMKTQPTYSGIAPRKQSWIPLDPDPEDKWLRWIRTCDGTDLPKRPAAKPSLIAKRREKSP